MFKILIRVRAGFHKKKRNTKDGGQATGQVVAATVKIEGVMVPVLNSDELYTQFKERLNSMAGECYRCKTALEAGQLVARILEEKKIQDLVLVESSLTKAANLREALAGRDIRVYCENFRAKASEVGAGVTELNWAIAELGTMVQIGVDVNQRLASMLPPIHVAFLQTSRLIPTLAETLKTIHSLPQIPGFVGFITGPSRTADIERVLTIGVHGPEQFIAVFIDEEVGEA